MIPTSNGHYFDYYYPPFETLFQLPSFTYFLLSLVVFLVLLFSLYRHLVLKQSYIYQNRYIVQSVDTATLGVKVFSHALKNQLLAIKEEASFILEVPESQAIQQNVDRIIAHCDYAIQKMSTDFHTIQYLTLEHKVLPVIIPIEDALSQITCSTPIEVIAPKHLPFVSIDAAHMTEVMINLIKNAQEALTYHPYPRIQIIIRHTPDWVTISIQDNGSGIPPEQLSTIFLPFVSSKSSSTNWGIGLAYCYKVIDKHNGKITAYNLDEGGACFTIMLPTL